MKFSILLFFIICLISDVFSQNAKNTLVIDVLNTFNQIEKSSVSVQKETYFEDFDFSSFHPKKVILDTSNIKNYYKVGYDKDAKISKVTFVFKKNRVYSIQRKSKLDLSYQVYNVCFFGPDGGREYGVKGFIVHVDTINLYFNYKDIKLYTDINNIGAIMPLDNKLNVITYLIYKGGSTIYFGEVGYKDTLNSKNVETAVMYIPKKEFKITQDTKLNEFNTFFNLNRDLYNYGFDIARVHFDIRYPYSYYPLWIFEDDFYEMYK